MSVAAAAYASVKWTASLVEVTVRLVPGSVAYCTCSVQVQYVSAMATWLEGESVMCRGLNQVDTHLIAPVGVELDNDVPWLDHRLPCCQHRIVGPQAGAEAKRCL
jgi:hypothetical protein